ncbi:recombinase family protein [Arthrobacter sp. MYb213]|uniref:recombinase family protein n=1 Tax=Arthrobacter sp. MYb213 TaxID=1848595 RepID=UPI000CFC9D11|nr:recombinase family protein [Arthrobacter sp. MYb213]PRB69484.1 hypothetical protein CQ011_12030 [Arthrobacter sp. MYb213]
MNPQTTPRPRAVLYLRQSVAKEESISLEVQEDAGRRYAAQAGYTVVAVEADHGISGRTWNRPAVQRVMTMIESQQADVIILWKWSRLSRARLDWAVAIDKVETAGGRIESATEQVDVSTSTGRFARGMLAEFAAFESERIGDTWKEAQARRVTQGLPTHGKRKLGYDYDRNAGYTINTGEAAIIRECYRRFIAGDSVQVLCDYLETTDMAPVKASKPNTTGLWHTKSLRSALDSPFMTGHIIYKGEVHAGAHEPLVDPELFEAYQVARKRRHRAPNKSMTDYPYSGMLYCGICGHKYSGGRVGDDTVSAYRCDGYGSYRLHKGGYVSTQTLNQAVLPWITELATQINQAAEANHTELPHHDPTPKLRRALMKVEGRRDSLTTRLLDGLVPGDVYERMRDQLAGEKARLEDQLRDARVASVARPAAMDADLLGQWEVLPVERRKAILRELVKGIVVTPQRPRSLVRIIAKWDSEELPTKSMG